jgi:hypothetical protein
VIFGKTVSGQISNIFSKNDEILIKLYNRIEKLYNPIKIAIGCQKIFVGMEMSKNKAKNEG